MEFFALWGRNATNLYFVGLSGKIFHFDGSVWFRMPKDSSETFYSIWGTGDDAWAVGFEGTIFYGQFGIFSDGFESGDTLAWTEVSP